MSGDLEGPKNISDEDYVEARIRQTGCWEQHVDLLGCIGDKKDWRQCQTQVQRFKECMGKAHIRPAEKK
ncbi:CHCH domain protein [Dictyocaulus viviparus]|uniref:CHCH domain protein n=1 Tax=Dictyocaulus viviparus TaxID=29172 RepID=A0A0D8XMB6_DICVI|nr:CHCH domain protein [Dictyocaulus viviparus]